MQTAVPFEIADWFAGRGWRIRRHQTDMLAASDAGRHSLLVADTGAGKTLAGFLPTLAAFAPSRNGGTPPEGLHTLYVSPLKALAHDVQRNLADRPISLVRVVVSAAKNTIAQALEALATAAVSLLSWTRSGPSL